MPYMGELKQSTQVTKTVLIVDSSDHITGKTGLSAGITKYLTKAGVSPGAATMTTGELDATNVKGIYSLVFTTAHTDTLGDFQLHLAGTGADPVDYWWIVVARLTDDLAYPATTGRPVVVDANGLVDATTVKIGPTGAGTAQTARDLGLALPAAAPQAAGGLITSTAGSLDMDDLAADVDATETRVVLALPAAAPQAAGGLITSTAGALDLDEMNVDIEAIQVSTANLPYGIKKNTALANFEVAMVLASDHVTAATGLSVTATVSIDGAGFVSATNAVAEVSNGIYKISLAAADLNGNVITLRFAAATADDRFVTIITVT